MHQQMEELDLNGIRVREQQYLQAKAVDGAGGASLEGKLYKNLTDKRHTTETCVCDTGCSLTICSLEIIKALKAEITPLKRNLQILDASGTNLKIIGTSTIFFSSQIINNKKKLLNCAVLDGPEREVLISLSCLKEMNLVHDTFPNQTVLSYIQDNFNKGYKTEHSHSLKTQSGQSVK